MIRFRSVLNYIDTISLVYDSPISLMDSAKSGSQSHQATPSVPNFAPKLPTHCWFECRRHSIANVDRMASESAMVTMERLGTLFGTITDPPMISSSPKRGVPNVLHGQLRDACCHLANMIEDINRQPCAVPDVIMSRAMSFFAKLLWHSCYLGGNVTVDMQIK